MISFFIPVRKESKRIKNKNILKLPGYRFGIVQIKLEQLQKLRDKILKNKFFFKKGIEFVISTNCKITKKLAKQYPWIKVHIRNKKNYHPNDGLNKLINIVPKICKGDYILWTHATSPFFNEDDYINFINIFFKLKKKFKSQSAFSADLIQKFLYHKKRGWISHNTKKIKWPRTQDLSNIYSANSAAFIAHRSIYINNFDRLCKKTFPILSRAGSSFDLDEKKDLIILKSLLKK